MLRQVACVTACALLIAAPLAAQEKAQEKAQEAKKAAEAKAAPPPAQEAVGQAVNVRIELTITDQIGPGTAAKKVISMIAADRQMNSVRSSSDIFVQDKASPVGRYRTVQINVDARPTLLKDGKIALRCGLEYVPGTAGASDTSSGPGLSKLNEQLGVIVESGKPVLLSQAADPATDRKITVELTATILK